MEKKVITNAMQKALVKEYLESRQQNNNIILRILAKGKTMKWEKALVLISVEA